LKNIFEQIPADLPEEVFDTLAQSSKVKIERIISKGHQTAPDTWYDQQQNEWIMVVKGAAILSFEHGDSVKLTSGDHFNIKAHCKHRVSWTDPDCETIWLAVHY
jgi:cupin 2 domain-containing protein